MSRPVFFNSNFSHVALLVPFVEKSAQFLNSCGIQTSEPEVFESEGTKEVYVGDYQDQSGLLLLLESIGEGPYQRALNKRGASLHHIAFDVLDLNEFVAEAKKKGWQSHPISDSKTTWLFFKGMPLLEIHQKKVLSNKPAKVSEIQLPIELKKASAFDQIMGVNVAYGQELSLVIDGKRLSFSQIACLK